MRTRRELGWAVLGLAVVALLFGGAGQAPVRAETILIGVDENGHGVIHGFAGVQPLPFALLADPGPGGLPAAVTYNLLNPPGLVAGDLLITEPGDGLGDVIRFNPTQNGGSLVFYSAVGGNDMADIGFPTANYTNQVMVSEINGGVTYIPTVGQPGFVAGAAAPVAYIIVSDTPEPASVVLLGLGGVSLVAWRRWKGRRTPA
jgi:hypothetical protein